MQHEHWPVQCFKFKSLTTSETGIDVKSVCFPVARDSAESICLSDCLSVCVSVRFLVYMSAYQLDC